MLTPVEQIAFLALVALCGLVAAHGFSLIFRTVRTGQAALRTDHLVGRVVKALVDIGLQKPIFKARPVVSVFHAFIFFGFTFYLLVNIADVLEGFVPGFTTVGAGGLLDWFNLFADLFSALVLTGMVFFLLRRFVGRPKVFEFNKGVLLHPKVARGGVKRDSLIVGVFILFHVGGRFTGSALHLAMMGHGDPWLPLASLYAQALSGLSPEAMELGAHVSWWLAMGLIVLFLPYFPFSKHIHLMIAPVNLILERRTARGQLDAVANAANPGAGHMNELAWPNILHSYACIMCTRCHEVCPAHNAGTPLSPSALEINKRYAINQDRGGYAGGQGTPGLVGSVISEDAVWCCTTCYACVRVCPVGNEPMRDIVEMRRRLTFEAKMPDELAAALRNLDEQGNSFGESNRKRSRWTKELPFPVKDAEAEPVKYLWFVGDFASFNANCQGTTRKVAQVLNAAGVDFGIMAKSENSAGNDARRVGEEGLFDSLADKNIEALAKCQFEEIITTDPHTYNTLKNEYPAKGATYKVTHYSEFLLKLIQSGEIQLKKKLNRKATYHDPCYLGRYNGVFDAPRKVMELCGVNVVEMPRNRENSFCCGAGGGRVWMKDHEDTTQRPSVNRILEAVGLGVNAFTVACPKDMTMFADSVKTAGQEGKMEVVDLIDYVLEAMDLAPAAGNAPAEAATQPVA
ncbi:MAG: (Fe-S)-binding protein [Deltaproteobacteria bacterium]|nr:(Fe-S)-binding protein [Deltaproteobacteria bacterium]